MKPTPSVDLAARINELGQRMQTMHRIPDDEWVRHRDAVLAELSAVESILESRHETLADYGWRLDDRCCWRRQGEAPVEPPQPDWSALDDEDLLVVERSYDADLILDDEGCLRAQNAGAVPIELRIEVRARWQALTSLLERLRGPPSRYSCEWCAFVGTVDDLRERGPGRWFCRNMGDCSYRRMGRALGVSVTS